MTSLKNQCHNGICKFFDNINYIHYFSHKKTDDEQQRSRIRQLENCDTLKMDTKSYVNKIPVLQVIELNNNMNEGHN